MKARYVSRATFDFTGKAALTALILALTTLNGPGPLIWASERPSAIDATRLRGAHDKLLATYAAERKRFSNTPIASLSYSKTPVSLTDFYAHLATTLEEAGVKSLLEKGTPEAMSLALRAEILNDYGFWLSKTNDCGLNEPAARDWWLAVKTGPLTGRRLPERMWLLMPIPLKTGAPDGHDKPSSPTDDRGYDDPQSVALDTAILHLRSGKV